MLKNRPQLAVNHGQSLKLAWDHLMLRNSHSADFMYWESGRGFVLDFPGSHIGI